MIYVMTQLAINCLVSYCLDLMRWSWSCYVECDRPMKLTRSNIWADRYEIIFGIRPWGTWKTFVTFVFKKGASCLPEYCRPMTHPCMICKIMKYVISISMCITVLPEHIVVKHMLHHLEEHRLLSYFYHGFKKGHSSEIQLPITIDDFYGLWSENPNGRWHYWF